MSQMEELPLVGYIEIARRAGVKRSSVTMWRSRHESFPDPVADLRVGPVWWWPDVQEWLQETRRPDDVNLEIEDIREARPLEGLKDALARAELEAYRSRFGPLTGEVSSS